MKERIDPKGGPPAIGPYSIAIRANGFIFVSGQGPLDPVTGQLIEGTFEDQVHRTMQNIRNILEAAGSSLEKIVKATVYLRDLSQFEVMNRVYAGYMAATPPARTTIGAADLPKKIDVEIDVIALG